MTITSDTRCKMDRPLDQQTPLRGGVSRERETSKAPVVVRWNGASRSTEPWDNLRRDPDLWFRDGDCYIHLYGKGQSRRGPAFKLPYAALVEAKCQPLIDMFMPTAHSKPNNTKAQNCSEAGSHPRGPTGARIELFIPAPAESSKCQSFSYHLATRNLFAFVFRKSLVGESLGNTLITLMYSLQQFRAPDADNVKDLMDYMDEEGYLELNGQPTYAAAMLILAEAFQFRDLYIDAFAHCCGMSERLRLSFEYRLIPKATRELVRHRQSEMYSMLVNASSMLKTFLDDEMHQMNAALCPGAQEHLELFRTLLHGVYAMRFGYYPPQTPVFDVHMFHAMRDDFEALYEFLRDESLEFSQVTRLPTEFGIPTLRSIRSFDLRHNHKTLSHPLPLLPDIARRKSSFWSRSKKTRQSERAKDLMAVSSATNAYDRDVIGNHLVSAYRRFEEDQVSSPIKAGKSDNLDPIDGRKVRWILVYAIYQTLRQATEVADGIRDVKGVPYHICISTTGLPPWETRQPINSFVHRQSDRSSQSPPLILSPSTDAMLDSCRLTPVRQVIWDTKTKFGNTIFKGSFADSISRRSSALWQSLTKHDTNRLQSKSLRVSYNEILVCGYGNGLNTNAEDKKVAAEASSHLLRERFKGWVPNSPRRYSHSEARSLATSDTYVNFSPPESPTGNWESERASLCMRCGLQDVNRGMNSTRRSKSLRISDSGYYATRRTIQFHDGEMPPVPPRRRPVSVYDDPHLWLRPAPLRVPKAKEEPTADLNIQMPSPKVPTAWNHVQGVMEVQARNYESRVEAERDQFTYPGRPGSPTPMTTSRRGRASAMF